jgi:NAD(P)-dependent dehydrogenase (short-subunit alcohol dehydrogenase family)
MQTSSARESSMQIEGKVVFVSGANRGLGKELVQALLDRGAAKIYAAARRIETLNAGDGTRTVAVALDLTSRKSIAAAAEAAKDVDILVNNASAASFASPLDADRSAIEHEMAVNYFGSYDLIRAFVPALRHNKGAVVNVLSLLSLSSTPPMAGYSASKAALHSMTQALRPVLAAEGIAVHGVYPGGIDTEMLAGIDAPKTAPGEVAAGLIDGLEASEEDIFPDPNAKAMAELWWSNPKAFERAFAGS